MKLQNSGMRVEFRGMAGGKRNFGKAGQRGFGQRGEGAG